MDKKHPLRRDKAFVKMSTKTRILKIPGLELSKKRTQTRRGNTILCVENKGLNRRQVIDKGGKKKRSHRALFLKDERNSAESVPGIIAFAVVFSSLLKFGGFSSVEFSRLSSTEIDVLVAGGITEVNKKVFGAEFIWNSGVNGCV